MKWIVRILGGIAALLVLAVLGLFLAGRRADAGRTHASLDVAASREQVWPWLTEPDKMKQWVDWLVEVRASDPTARPGAKRTLVMRDPNNGGKLMEIDNTVVDTTPPSKLTMTMTSPGVFTGDQVYQVSDLGNGHSRIEIDSTYHFDSGMMRLLEPMVTKATQQKTATDMARLKQLVEANPTAAK